jgi:hypothetical protein
MFSMIFFFKRGNLDSSDQSQKKIHFDFIFVDEEDFEKYKPDSFAGLVKHFRKHKDSSI